MKFVRIKYAGAKTYRDTTDLHNVWEPGDVNMVTEADAKKLLRYIEFRRATDEPKALASELELATKANASAVAEKKKEQKLVEDTLLELTHMSKADLAQFAKNTYGVDMDKRSSVETIRLEVTKLVQDGAV